MKFTTNDYDLADRFPESPRSSWGYGIAPCDAKVSPDQLTRLLKLALIKIAPAHELTGGYCGGDAMKNPGKGFGRTATTFVRTYGSRPKGF